MAYSKTCKIVSVLLVSAAVVVVVILIVRSLSSRICPENELMFRNDEKCYTAGATGPCKNSLIFLEEDARSSYGECNCPYTKYNRTLVYHKETEQCYFVFTKAYCDANQWLTIRKDKYNKWEPVCEVDNCTKKETGPDGQFGDNVQLVPVKGGGCARLGVHEEGCPEGAVVQFHKDYILPSCFPPPKLLVNKIGSIGVPASHCRIGSYPSIMGKCQPQFEFDFD